MIRSEYLNEYKVSIQFNTGRIKVIDMALFLSESIDPLISQYKNKKKFRAFRIDSGTLIWGDNDIIFSTRDVFRSELSPVAHVI